MTTTIPSPRERTRTDGTRDYIVDMGIINGKRKQFFRKTPEEATYAATEYMATRSKVGDLADLLTPAQLVEAHEAIQVLEGTGMSLVTLARAHVDSEGSAEVSVMSVMSVYRSLLDNMQDKGLRVASITSSKNRLSSFESMYGSRYIDKITTADIKAWLSIKDVSPGSKGALIQEVKTLFNYAVKNGWLDTNPVDPIDKPKVERELPQYMTVEQVTLLLHYSTSRLRMYFALGFFQGIRPAELDKLTWGHINLDEMIIKITPDISKVRRCRNIDIERATINFINDAKQGNPKDKILNTTITASRQGLCKDLDIKWTADVMRHTYSTMHLARGKDANYTAFQLGHDDPKLLMEHYRGLATSEEAEKYWALGPDK